MATGAVVLGLSLGPTVVPAGADSTNTGPTVGTIDLAVTTAADGTAKADKQAAKDAAQADKQAAKDSAQAAKDAAEADKQAAKDAAEADKQAAKDAAQAAKEAAEADKQAAKDAAEADKQAAQADKRAQEDAAAPGIAADQALRAAVRSAGDFTRGELRGIFNDCKKRLPKNSDTSPAMGACMVGVIASRHVVMVNGKPYDGSPQLGAYSLQKMVQRCHARYRRNADFGTCLARAVNNFYGL